VGHPVIENCAYNGVDKDADDGIEGGDNLVAFKIRYKIPEKCTIICILPGSRHSEVKRLIPTFRKVIERVRSHYPDLFVVIPSVEAIVEEVRRAFADMAVPHRLLTGQRERYEAFRASRFAIAASGTVTLELAACGTPHLIAYKFSGLTNRVVKFLITTKYANLINILANKFVIPEFVLDNCRDDLIYAKALELMQDPNKAQEQVAQAQQYLAQLMPLAKEKEERRKGEREKAEDGKQGVLMPSEAAAAVVLEELGLLVFLCR
jgi:lipid-A-disaccharide synthase